MRLSHQALVFATERHCAIDHVRKYTGDPYITHPIAVANIVRSVEHNEEMLAAAYLHDVVEDTETTLAQIWNRFGRNVMDLVDALTDIAKPEDGNRTDRVAMNRRHAANGGPMAQTIKLADIIDNADSIKASGDGFWHTYRREMELLVPLLGRGDPLLQALARDKIRRD